ncbi:hypothetical protein BZM27_06180 [Paraburkholderia steynii]|uniref:Uncharacterized protein n=1 Tax=Paraburkholderia steynii TaxID=1245441 RepID=A0A4R0XKI3_9BURK|nr:hypothetical protein BZM27_06180 [Paraburkholderia steynii]
MATPNLTKDPGATLDFGFDLSPNVTPLYAPWLAAGEQVVSLNVTADPGITIGSSSIVPNAGGIAGALVTAWISGGTAGNSYAVHFAFTTNSTPPRTDVRSMQIVVQSR